MPDQTIVKSFSGFEIKDEAKGEVEAMFATLGVVDKDEDIIRPGGIPDGAKVSMSSYGHSAVHGDAPVGKGTIHIDGNKAVFKGRVFLKTHGGREAFETLKEMGPDQEWSWGFRILGAEVPTDEEKKLGARRAITKTDTFEVSPVLRGAGIGTRTMAVKSADDAPDPAIEAARLKAEEDAKALAELNAKADRRAARVAVGIRR